jgi:hypothetical protein
MKQIATVRCLLALAIPLAGIAAGCGGIPDVSSEDALYELAGRWYNSRCDFAFEITQAGEGYIAQNKTQYAVSVSRRYVYFRDSHNYLTGSFRYSVKKGELTATLGTGDFEDIQSSSPLIKSGAIPSGGIVPVELIGKWYAKTNPPPVPNFEITASSEMKTTISGSAVQYTVVVSENTISVLDGIELKGAFQYSIMYDEMIVTNGTDLCAGLKALSPFIKKNI